MRYVSTRGGMAPATFSDILLGGLAPDGGLTIPDTYPTLAPGESCATIEVKINYFKPVRHGTLSCETVLVNRGRSIANLESRVLLDGKLVASANGNYAILQPRSAG